MVNFFLTAAVPGAREHGSAVAGECLTAAVAPIEAWCGEMTPSLPVGIEQRKHRPESDARSRGWKRSSNRSSAARLSLPLTRKSAAALFRRHGDMQIPGAEGACRCHGLWSYFVSGRPFRAADVLRAGWKSPPAVRVT